MKFDTKYYLKLLFLLLTLLFLAIILFTYMFRSNMPKMTKEELAVCLINNMDSFENSAELILNYNIQSINKGSFLSSNKEFFYYNLKNGQFLVSKKSLSSDTIKEIKSSSLTFILKELRFEKIVNDDGHIFYIEGSDLSMAHGIVFSSDGTEPRNMYIIEIEKLEENWFYCKER